MLPFIMRYPSHGVLSVVACDYAAFARFENPFIEQMAMTYPSGPTPASPRPASNGRVAIEETRDR